MPKTNITTFTIAGQLKSGMNAAGNYPVPGDMNAIYTAQNAIWVVLGTTTGGLIRCIGNTADFTDLFNPSDPDIVRAWSMAELTEWFVSSYVYDNYAASQQGGNFTVSFTVEGTPFSGTSNREVDAFASAIIDLINSPVAINALVRTPAAPPKKTTSKK